MLRDILDILKFVHRKKIIHRDLKPANLIRRKTDGKIFLIDFGAVKEIATLHQNSSGASLTRVVSTPGYMPVEQAIGNPQFNSDIYALGIIALQTITDFSLQDIYDSDSEPITDKQCNYIWQHEAYRHISQGLKQIVSKMIQYNFNERYQSVQEALHDLDKLETGEKFTIINNDIISNGKIPSSLNRPRQSYQLESQEKTLNINRHYNSRKGKIKFTFKHKGIIFTISLLSVLTLAGISYLITNSRRTACNKIREDYISCGEEILSPYSKDVNRQRAAGYLTENQYDKALRYFNRSWEVSKEAETLIYMNNTLLEAIDADYYTLAVAVPLSYQGITPKNYQLAQDFLRGVAQAQTQVNLNLLDSHPEATYSLPGRDFLPRKVISSGQKPKGLRIVIVDDRNEPDHTKKLAHNIANKSEILGVIGHYASNISLSAVDEYQKKNLSQVSFGTTTIDLTENPKPNFFRVVYNNYQEADAIVDYISQFNIAEKKIAVFYNPGSTYSTDFLQEIEKRVNPTASPVKIVKKFNLADEQNFNIDLALKTTQDLGANIILLLPDGQISNSKALENAIEIIAKDDGKTEIIGGNPLVNPKVEEIKTNNSLKLTVSSFWHHLDKPDSTFTNNSKKLWEIDTIYSGTATAYDATLVLIEALRQQNKPTRKGTLETISAPGFFIKGSTGDITFNTPQNGDRNNFEPTTVKLINCGNYNAFLPVKQQSNQISNLACN